MNTNGGPALPAGYGSSSGYQSHHRLASNTASVDRPQSSGHEPPHYAGPPLTQLHRVPLSVESTPGYGRSNHGGAHPESRSGSGPPQVAPSLSPSSSRPVAPFPVDYSPSSLNNRYEANRSAVLPTPPTSGSGSQPNPSVNTHFNQSMAQSASHHISPFPAQPSHPPPTRRATLPSQTHPPAPLHVNDPASSLRHPANTAAASPVNMHPLRRNESQIPQSSTRPQQTLIDPTVHNAAEIALQPVRSAIESLWNLTLQQMHHGMNKMHQDYTTILSQLRQHNSQLVAKTEYLSHRLKQAEEASANLQKDNQRLNDNLSQANNLISAFRAEHDKIQTEHDELKLKYDVLFKIQSERPVMGEGKDTARAVDINTLVGVVTERMAKQMDNQMTEIRNEMQEQKTLRIRAEEKMAETMEQLKQAQQGLSRSASVTLSTPDMGSVQMIPTLAQLAHSRRPSSPMLEGANHGKRLSISSHSSTSTRIEKPSMSPSVEKGLLPAPAGIPQRLPEQRNLPPLETAYRSPQSSGRSPILASPMQLHHEPLRRPSPPIQHPITDFTPRTPPAVFPSPPRKRSRAEYESEERQSIFSSDRPLSKSRTETSPPAGLPNAAPSQRSTPPPAAPSVSMPPRRESFDTTPVFVKEEPNDDMDYEEGEIGDSPSQAPTRTSSPLATAAARAEQPPPHVASRLPTPPPSGSVNGNRLPPVQTPPRASDTPLGDPLSTNSLPSKPASRPKISSVPRPGASRSNTTEKPTLKGPSAEASQSVTGHYRPQTFESTPLHRSPAPTSSQPQVQPQRPPQPSKPQSQSQTQSQLQPKVQPAAPRPPPPPPRPKTLGINHINLLYKTENGSMICRMCISRKMDAIRNGEEHDVLPLTKFPVDASWPELISHCRDEHPNACADLEKVSPSQLAEMRQRMVAGDTPAPMRRK